MSGYLLHDNERRAAVAALHAYRSETLRYLRDYEQPGGGHDDCCKVARAREVQRNQAREALNTQLHNIDGALQSLDLEGYPPRDSDPTVGRWWE